MIGMFNWTDSNVERLKVLWEQDNITCLNIAEELGTNKSSVLGKAFRLGLRKKANTGKGVSDSVFRGSPSFYNKYRRKKKLKKKKKKVRGFGLRLLQKENSERFWSTWDSAVNTPEKRLNPNDYEHKNSLVDKIKLSREDVQDYKMKIIGDAETIKLYEEYYKTHSYK